MTDGVSMPDVHKNAPHKPVRISPLGALRVLDPDKWEAEIRQAMESADGRVPEAAEKLEVSKRQLYRWLTDPRFRDVERAVTGKPPNRKADLLYGLAKELKRRH